MPRLRGPPDRVAAAVEIILANASDDDFLQLRYVSNEFRLLGLNKYWLTNTIYVHNRPAVSSIPEPAALFPHRPFIADTRRGTTLPYAFFINPNGWHYAWRPPHKIEATQWALYCGGLSDVYSRLSHLCEFGFEDLVLAGPGTLHAGPYGAGANLQLHDLRIRRPPVREAQPITNRYEAGLTLPQIANYQHHLRYSKYMNKVEALESIRFCVKAGPLRVLPWPTAHELTQGDWPSRFDFLFLPTHALHVPYGMVSVFRRTVGLQPQILRARQLFALVWIQMVDLRGSFHRRRAEFRRFRNAERDVLHHVSSLLSHRSPQSGSKTPLARTKVS